MYERLVLISRVEQICPDRDYKTCLCSTQLSMTFSLLINVKMTTILNAKYKDPTPPPDPRMRITCKKRPKDETCTNLHTIV